MMKKAFIIGMVLVGSLATVAQPNGDGKRGYHGDRSDRRGTQENRGGRMIEALNLTEEQQAVFKEKKVALEEANKDLRSQIKTKRDTLHSMAFADKVNQKGIDKTIAEIGDLESEMLKNRIDHMIALRSVLTDEQKVTFDEQVGRQKELGRREPPREKGRG